MPRVRVKDGEREEVREILGPVLTFGRAPDNHIILTDRECSRHHCYIEKVEQGYKLVDLESRNGTKANGNFRNQLLLQSGDVMTIGKAEIHFIDENAPPVPRPVVPDVARATGPVTKSHERVTAPLPRSVTRAGATATAPSPRVDSSHGSSPAVSPPDVSTRTASNTSGRRSARSLLEERSRERRTLTAVFVAAGAVILFLVVLFVLFLTSGAKNESQYVTGLFATAAKIEKEAQAAEDPDVRIRHFQEAITQYRLVPPSSEPAYTNARKRMDEVGVLLKQAQQDAAGRRIQKEMQEIDQLLKQQQPPDTFGALTRLERLLEKTPKDHPLHADIQKRIVEVKAMRDAPPSER